MNPAEFHRPSLIVAPQKAMIPGGPPFVPTSLGLILLAAGTAAGHELAMSTSEPDWSMLLRVLNLSSTAVCGSSGACTRDGRGYRS